MEPNKAEQLCCMLDPLRGCKICGWRICSYHYMVSQYIGDRRSVAAIHKFIVGDHELDIPNIISFRDMTNVEAQVGKILP